MTRGTPWASLSWICAALTVGVLAAGRASVLPAESIRLVSNDGTYFVDYERPAEVPLNEPISLAVQVFEDAERTRPAQGVELTVDARMPHHKHGLNREPLVRREGEASFAVEGLVLFMPGYWELYLDVTRGAVTERAQDSIELE